MKNESNKKTTTIKTINFKDCKIEKKVVGLNQLKEQYEVEFKSAIEGLYSLDLIIQLNNCKNAIENEKSKDSTNKEKIIELNQKMAELKAVKTDFDGSFDNFTKVDGVAKLLAWAYYPTKNVSFKNSISLLQDCYNYYISSKKVDETKKIKNTLIEFINEKLEENSDFRIKNINNSTLSYILNVAFVKSGIFNKKGVRNFETLDTKTLLSCRKKLIRQIILSTIGERVGYSKKDRQTKVAINLYEI